MPLKYECTKCGREIIVKYLKVGEVAKCRNCGAEVTVPPTAITTDQRPSYETLSVHEPVDKSQPVDIKSLASRVHRFVAHLIDGLIYTISWVLILLGEDFPGLLVLGVFTALALLVIQIVLLSINGQTIGKSALKIKIVKMTTGKNGGFVINVLLREVVNTILSIIPFYGLVDILFIFREDRRCIHDFIAGTRVVWAEMESGSD